MRHTHAWFIQKADWASQLPPDELVLIQEYAIPLRKGRGDYIDLEQDGQNRVYIVRDGYIRNIRMNMEGKRFTINIIRPGEFFGAILSVPQAEREDEFLEVMSEVQLLSLDGQVFSDILSRHPGLCFSVLQILENRNRRIETRLSSLLFKDVYARVAELFLAMNFSHGEVCPYAFGLTRDICLTHQEIAELVGATRPVVSSVVGQFLKKDLVHKHDGYICLQDLERLKRVSDQGACAVSDASSVS